MKKIPILTLGIALLNIGAIKAAQPKTYNDSRVQLQETKACRGCDLKKAPLSGKNLENVNLQNADLREAKLKKTNLKKANLYGTKLQKAELQDANLSGANLENADLTNANLKNADLRFAQLRNTNFTNADLTNANLQNAVELNQAILTGAKLSQATWKDGVKCLPNSQAIKQQNGAVTCVRPAAPTPPQTAPKKTATQDKNPTGGNVNPYK